MCRSVETCVLYRNTYVYIYIYMYIYIHIYIYIYMCSYCCLYVSLGGNTRQATRIRQSANSLLFFVGGHPRRHESQKTTGNFIKLLKSANSFSRPPQTLIQKRSITITLYFFSANPNPEKVYNYYSAIIFSAFRTWW